MPSGPLRNGESRTFPIGNRRLIAYTPARMFTGIIEKSARVIGVIGGPKFVRLTVAVDWTDVRLGESVAVNGVCLTVAEFTPGALHFDVVLETLNKTNLGIVKSGDEVHVERSLRVGDRVDGHFVQGHVDGVATLLDQTSDEREWRLTCRCQPALSKFLAPKGSIALDGVSLTIAAVKDDEFQVVLIPTTVTLTALTRRPVGWPFNIEADIISKTVVSWLERQRA
jgi:riboflavin synthase